MATGTSTEGVARPWYQRTWLWLVVASLALPLSVGFLILGVMVLDRNWVVASIGSLSMALVPIGMWMAALVAKHAWTRAVLAIATTLLIVVAFFSLYSYGNRVEKEALRGCELIATADGGVVRRDAELCGQVTDGSLERNENLRFLVLGVTWAAPLVVLYAFRKRLRPDH